MNEIPKNHSHHHPWWKSGLVTVLGAFVLFLAAKIESAWVYSNAQSKDEGKIVQKIEEWEQWRKSIDANNVITSATLTRMDGTGTNASHWALDSVNKAIQKNTDRIESDEKALGDIAVIKEKLARIEQDVHEIKTRK